MRILFCNYEYPPLGGGGGVANALLAEELARRHDVTVLTSRAFDLPAERREHGVRVVRARVPLRGERSVASLASMLAFVPAGLRVGRDLVGRDRFDLINTHFVLPTGPVGDALARRAVVPNVLSLHGGDLYDPSKWTSPHRHLPLRVWIRRLLRRADVVVGQSTNTLLNMRRFYTPDIAGVRIPLGIRRPEQGQASRADYQLPPDAVLLVTVGRLVRRKAVDQLIQVVRALRDTSAHLLVVGSGPQATSLWADVEQHGLQERVHFLGYLDEHEKFRVLRMADVYVSTAQHEGFGLTFVEAMTSALPVVCYDCGGQTDFLADDATGSVVPLNDLDRFTTACRRLVMDPNLRRSIGRENQLRANDYVIEECASRYERLFCSLVPRPAHPSLGTTVRRP